MQPVNNKDKLKDVVLVNQSLLLRPTFGCNDSLTVSAPYPWRQEAKEGVFVPNHT